jgi:hypothetical protein
MLSTMPVNNETIMSKTNWQKRTPFPYLLEMEVRDSQELASMVQRDKWQYLRDLKIWCPGDTDSELLIYYRMHIVQKLLKRIKLKDYENA